MIYDNQWFISARSTIIEAFVQDPNLHNLSLEKKVIDLLFELEGLSNQYTDYLFQNSDPCVLYDCKHYDNCDHSLKMEV